MIHRIGAVPILQSVAEATSGPLADLRNNPGLLEELLTSYYPLIGLHVVHEWDLPAELMATTYFHAEPARCPNSTHAVPAHIVSLAEMIASVSGYPAWGKADESLLMADDSTQFLGLTDIKIANIRVELDDRVAPLLEATEAGV